MAGCGAEQLGLAKLCLRKKLNAAAARFFADVFAAQPKLANDLEGQHRYDAACATALAAAEQGQDAAKIDEEERAGSKTATSLACATRPRS